MKKEVNKMSYEDMQKLMVLIEKYGNACEYFGDYQTMENSLNCGIAKNEIKEFLYRFIQ